jgi:hypothetical protein
MSQNKLQRHNVVFSSGTNVGATTTNVAGDVAMALSALLLCMLFAPHLSAQTKPATHDYATHGEVHRNELGLANAPVYYLKEKTVSYGLHLHYIRSVPRTNFGFGLGYERIFDDHQHQTIGLVGTYRPIDRLSLNVAPGLTFEKDNKTGLFAVHVESAYEWEFKNLHIGPAAELAYDKDDYHFSCGLHLGYGF